MCWNFVLQFYCFLFIFLDRFKVWSSFTDYSTAPHSSTMSLTVIKAPWKDYYLFKELLLALIVVLFTVGKCRFATLILQELVLRSPNALCSIIYNYRLFFSFSAVCFMEKRSQGQPRCTNCRVVRFGKDCSVFILVVQ